MCTGTSTVNCNYILILAARLCYFWIPKSIIKYLMHNLNKITSSALNNYSNSMRAYWKGKDITSMRKEIGAPGSTYMITLMRRIKSLHSTKDHWAKMRGWMKKIMNFPFCPGTKKRVSSFDPFIFIAKLNIILTFS